MSTALGNRLKQLRREKRLSKKRIADISRVDEKTIGRIESGYTSNPRDETLELLAQVLEANVQELIDLRDNGQPNTTAQTNPQNTAVHAVLPEPSEIEPAILESIEPAILEPVEPRIVSGRVIVPEPETNPERDLNDSVVPIPVPIPAPDPEQDEDENRDRQRRHRWYVLTYGGVAIVCLVIAAIVYLVFVMPWVASSKKVAISGQVTCADNLRVEGVYIKLDNGAGNYVDTHKLNDSGTTAHFAYALPQGGPYNVHVGCGTDGNGWLNSDDTDYGSGLVKDYKYHDFICQDTPLTNGNGRCFMTK